MTYSIGLTVFSGSRRLRGIAAALTLLAAGGCASTGSENASAPPAGLAEGARDTGTFPNLNIPAPSAAPQFTDQQKAAKLAALKTDQQATQSGGGGKVQVANQSEMAALAKNHGKDTLKEIEGKCDPTLDPTCK